MGWAWAYRWRERDTGNDTMNMIRGNLFAISIRFRWNRPNNFSPQKLVCPLHPTNHVLCGRWQCMRIPIPKPIFVHKSHWWDWPVNGMHNSQQNHFPCTTHTECSFYANAICCCFSARQFIRIEYICPAQLRRSERCTCNGGKTTSCSATGWVAVIQVLNTNWTNIYCFWLSDAEIKFSVSKSSFAIQGRV